MKKYSFAINRLYYISPYLFLFSCFFLFTGLECNQEGTPEILRAHFIVQPENGDVNTVFTFDATQSTTPHLQITNYSWDFNNDAIYEIIGATKDIVTHQFTEKGTYIVKLKIRDDQDFQDLTTRAVVVGEGSSCYNDFHKPCPDQPTITWDGQTYKTVQIGDQCWFAENLNNGTSISTTGDVPSDNNVNEMFCYEDNTQNCAKYGGLFNWKEAMKYSSAPGAQGICPEGWHIPTQADWDKLANTLGGYDVAGRKMMSCEDDPWGVIDLNNNSSGFTAYPGGRYWLWFDGIEEAAYFWTSDSHDDNNVYFRKLHREEDALLGNEENEYFSWDFALSVRCVKD